jgi:ribonuclease D
MQTALLIATSPELLHALDAMRASTFVALDTEFMRESTYYPKLCLVQAATDECCAVIDPLVLTDLRPLWEFLADRSRVKVLHAARQDLEVLSIATRGAALPGPIFDTQIAGALLGSPGQAGYAALVAERLGRSLAKEHTRTDWSRRPLSAEQLQYAADDVRYLAPLYRELNEALVLAGRLDWLYEETREFEQPQLHRVDPALAWRRLKGLDRLQPAQRSAAKELAIWREATAIRLDKPRGWILADDALREIAERMPTHAQDLERIRSLPPATLRRRGDELLALVAQGRARAVNEPDALTPQRPDASKLALVTKLMSFVRSHAADLKLSPELLATRRDVEQLVFSRRSERLMNGWRRALIGERLVRMSEQASGAP